VKKITTLIIFIILFVSLVGCGSDQYAVEKRYWQIQREAKKIFKNPHTSPPNELERVVKLLNTFVQKYPKSNLSIEAEFTIARLYIVKEEYDKSRTQLKTILNKYSKSESICSEALFLIGNSYEIENNWDLALEQYRGIMRDYSSTPKGFNIPIYIAQHYKIKYQPDKMIIAFQEAIKHYRELANRYPDSPIGFKAYILVSQCYIELGDWQNAIKSYNTILENYKGKVNLDGILMDMALIYIREIKDKVKAKEILEKLVKEYPKSRLIKQSEALLKEVDK